MAISYVFNFFRKLHSWITVCLVKIEFCMHWWVLNCEESKCHWNLCWFALILNALKFWFGLAKGAQTCINSFHYEEWTFGMNKISNNCSMHSVWLESLMFIGKFQNDTHCKSTEKTICALCHSCCFCIANGTNVVCAALASIFGNSASVQASSASAWML